LADDSREYSIRRVTRDGLTVTLSDGSRWSINVGDCTKTSCWYPTMRVSVAEEPEDQIYPYRLANLDTFRPDVVRAQRK